MTGQEALNLIMGRLNRTNPTLRANVLTEMKLMQAMLEKAAVLPDWLYVYDESIALTADNRRFTLPADFLRLDEEDDGVWILDDDGEYQLMTQVGFDDTEFERSETGELPLKFALRGLYGYTFPIPTVSRTIKMNYYGKGTTIADDAVETTWLIHAPDLLIGRTGMVVTATYVKDYDVAAFFKGMADEAAGRMLIEQTARAEAGRSRRMG